MTDRETSTYQDALSLPTYGDFSPGETYALTFASLASPGTIVLDAGAGTGRGMRALEALGFTVYGVDLPDMNVKGVRSGVCLWKDIPRRTWSRRYDYVYCTDVLEHIPPEFTMLVVQNLITAARRGVFLSIALVPDHFGSWVGHPLHLTVRRYDEWLANLNELAKVTDARDLGTTGLYFLEPK